MKKGRVDLRSSVFMAGNSGPEGTSKLASLWRSRGKLVFPAVVMLLGVQVLGCPSGPDPVDEAQAPGLPARIKAGGGGQTYNVPARPPQPPATVAIIKDNAVNYSTMVSQALEAALGPGGISNLVQSGKTVLIKPNLVSNTTLAVTDWRVVKALVDQIKTVNGGAAIYIAEGSASNSGTTTKTIMANQGYTSTNFPGVTFVDFNNTSESPTNTYVLADSITGSNKQVSYLIHDADVYISMPKMKTHADAGLTGAVKNLGIGTPPWPLWNNPGSNTNKGGLHHDIRSEMVDHIRCRVPDLTLMDAIQAMEGNGPSNGTAVTMNLVLASKDPVALDAVACNIMDIPPSLIAHLALAANENVGVLDMSKITVTGNATIAAVRHTFTRAPAATPAQPYEPGAMPYRNTTVIRTAPSAMTIDGDLSEWGYANVAAVDATYQVKGGGSGWGGTSDASAAARLLYDSQNLYLAVQVKDDVKRPNGNTGSAIVNGEGIELYLSTYSEQYSTSRGTSYSSQYDYHLAISYADSPQAYLLSHSRALSGAVFAKVDTSDGYIIEALIPWSNFGSPTLGRVTLAGSFSEYRQLGINLAVNDADNSATVVDHKLIWNNATASDVETNPQKMGMSYLDLPGGLYPPLQFTLTISANHGTVTKNPDQASYQAGTMVTLTATPEPGYVFTGWTGSVSSTANPVSFAMDGKKTVTANFQTTGVLTAIVVSPASVSVSAGGTQPYGAVAYDQGGDPLVPQPSFAWTVSGGGVIDGNGLFTAGALEGGPFTVAAASGGVTGTAQVTVIAGGTPPVVVNPAAATPNPAAGTFTALSALATDDQGEASLTYTWATTGTPPAAVTFSANGSNAAKNTTATFSKAGTYNFQVTIADQGGMSTTSATSVTVDQTLTSVVVAPTSVTVDVSATRQFTATARDQFGANLSAQPTFDWTVSGGGSISSAGLFTAGSTAGGPFTVAATSGGISGSASVTVSAMTPTAKYRINCGSSSAPSPFAGDQYGSGGTQRTVTNSITISGVTNPAPTAVYQSERYGNSTYTFPNLTAGAQHTVRLHFAELYQTASGKRKFNVAINGTAVLSSFDVYAAAGGNYRAIVREFTTTANSSGQIVVAFTTVTDNATIEGIEIWTATADAPPTVAAVAAATPNPVTGATSALSALGADDGGEGNLTYTWATTGTPPAAVSFSVNGSNAAKNTTATFTKAGTYSFQVTIRDQSSQTATSNVTVVVNQTLTGVVVSPSTASVSTSATQQFTATARDQFAANLTTQPAFAWSVSGGGTISSAGLFTAGGSAGGPYTATATGGGMSGSASITVTSTPATVYQISCGSSTAASPFQADQYGSGGTKRTVTNTITISGISNPAPQAVYQSERYGNSTYTFPNLTAGASYRVRLHFAELYQTASGKRKFNVVINGSTVLSSFDIYATVGARYRALLREFTAAASSSGQIVINLQTVTDNATIEGIEIIRL
jgi:uncharacterized repeat protein (TIGR02543 family)